MAKYKVFIDGSSGTTGLRIADRLAGAAFADTVELLAISEAGRKDAAERAKVINSADLAFLCLPDAASIEVLPLLCGKVKVLDTSTAFRTAPGWVYGFPELHGQRAALKTANRIAVPGCHASGFISIARPLVELGLAGRDYPFTCHSLTGYSGGGKKMIAEYEAAARPAGYAAPRAYGLNLHHKHLPEMRVISGLASDPVFCPIVDDYYSGMEVTVPLHTALLRGHKPAEIAAALAEYYAGEPQIAVHALGELPADGMLSAAALAGTDRMELYFVQSPDESQMLCVSLFDNLGKGSSGAAVQCMNLALGLPEATGLE